VIKNLIKKYIKPKWYVSLQKYICCI